MKDKTILIHPSGSEIEFTPDHAERLMKMTDNGGWKRKKSKGNGVGNRANKEDSKGAEE